MIPHAAHAPSDFLWKALGASPGVQGKGVQVSNPAQKEVPQVPGGCTTLMVRNIPGRYTKEDFADDISGQEELGKGVASDHRSDVCVILTCPPCGRSELEGVSGNSELHLLTSRELGRLGTKYSARHRTRDHLGTKLPKIGRSGTSRKGIHSPRHQTAARCGHTRRPLDVVRGWRVVVQRTHDGIRSQHIITHNEDRGHAPRENK